MTTLLETQLLEEPLVLSGVKSLLEHLLHVPLGGGTLSGISDADP